MVEKVLGFKEKDLEELIYSLTACLGVGGASRLMHFPDKSVPVVSLEWLEKWCNENELFKAVNTEQLLDAARKESERK